MHNLILSTTPVDLTNIITGVNYVNGTTTNTYFNNVKILTNNIILYTTSDNSILNIDNNKFSDETGNILNITSNTNIDGKGIITFADNIYNVDSGICSGQTGLTSISMKKAKNILNCSSMFYECRNLSGVSLNTSNVTDMNRMFYECSNLSGVSLNTSNVTDMNRMFYNCSNLSSVTLSDTSNVTNMSSMFDFFGGSLLRYINITNLGKQSAITSIDFSPTIWGSGSTADEIATNTQSIRDTLITNSFDRATAGYSTCTLTLLTYTKGLLTDIEKAQITAKGYTIAEIIIVT